MSRVEYKKKYNDLLIWHEKISRSMSMMSRINHENKTIIEAVLIDNNNLKKQNEVFANIINKQIIFLKGMGAIDQIASIEIELFKLRNS